LAQRKISLGNDERATRVPRKLLILALTIVGLHVGQELILGTSAAGSLVANLLQISATALAAWMCFGASRRAEGMARPFWIFIGCGVAAWGVANLGWLFYEVVLRSEPPAGSGVRFLFNFQTIFFAMVMFLDQEKDSARIEPAFLLDFSQIAIVFFLIFFGLYYVPSIHTSLQGAAIREFWTDLGRQSAILALAVFQMARARSPHIRRLYAEFVAYFSFYMISTGVASYHQTIQSTPTGTVFDLCWTLPFLYGVFWAARWQQAPATQIRLRLRRKTFSGVLLANGMFVLAPLIVLTQVAQLPPEWRLLRFSLLGISILCFAVRVGISEYHETKSAETVRRQTLAMDSVTDGIAILGENGEHAYVNAAFARMLGHESPGAVQGMHWRKVYDPGDIERYHERIHQSLSQTGKWSGQIRLRGRDGRYRPVEMAITFLASGVTACIGRDISEREQSEKARADAEIKYRMLIEQVAAISYIAELGLRGEWLYVSPQVESILGYTQEEWLANSRNWIRYIPEEDHVVVEAAETASQRGEQFQAEYRVIRKDGTTIWISDTAVVVPGSDSHPVMEGIMVDITERKVLENQLQQSRRMEAVGRLAGGIAHDFNNLLTIIKGYAEMALQRPGVQREVHADVRHMENAADRASSLVRQLLAFSRRQVLQPKTIDLNAIVLGLDKLLRRLIDEAIEMVTCCGSNAGNVKADPAQIEQVIMNLVVNARDAMPRGGRLIIETSNVELDSVYARDHATVKPGPYVMLAVSDTGIGMSSETMAHIFEPFYTTKESGQGTGLGLSTVYGIVKQSGGYIWVYSEVEKGTTFKVYLPRVEEPAEAKEEAVRTPAIRKGTETILVVEDEEAVRELTCMVLTAEGYSVEAAESAREAERISANYSGEIHLLLTDIVMPGTSGRELASRITARHPRTRVLYMSGYTDNMLTQGGVLQEGVSFLQKPFSPRTLAQKVREVLDQPVAVR
jgi:PAS domain S-box-containing protein